MPLVENRLLFLFLCYGQAVLRLFSLPLSVFGNAKLRRMLPQAQNRCLFDCLPPQGYAANRFRRRCVKGLMSRSHLMTLSKITYFTT